MRNRRLNLFPGISSFGALHGIAHGNGRFVAVAANRSLTSIDGVKWVEHDSGGGSKVAYGGGQFVAAGYDGIATSIDGANWIRRESGTMIPLSGIAYGNGQFVAVGGPWTGPWSRCVIPKHDSDLN